MASHQVARVHRVMDHIRGHLTEDLSLQSLAKLAHASPYHFHRMFRFVAGETLVQFIQRSRLERAAYLMKATPSRTLVSIALEVGFSEQSDFSRVFKARYGLAPSQWDRRSRLSLQTIPGYESQLAEIKASLPVPSVSLVEHSSCRLIYVRVQAPFVGPALHEGYERLTTWLSAMKVAWRELPLVGLSWDNYETTPIDKVRYDLGFEVPDLEPSEEFGVHELPAMRAAQVHCVGPLSHIAVAWDHLYDTWLPNSDYEPEDLPGLKRFRLRPDELGWDTYDLDCCLAVRPVQP